MKGKELLKRVNKSKLKNEENILRIMYNLISGLKVLHSSGIMHRDLKPDNIMVRSKSDIFDVCIVDFGLAEFINADTFLYRRCGTPGFVAPEIIML